MSASPLSTQLGFTLTTLSQRKVVVRDIVSSFDSGVLPSEFRPHIYQCITDEQSMRPNVEWTIPGDLSGTLMQWGVHDLECWALLNKCQPPTIRAILFAEKLQRRFEDEFERYDHISSPAALEPETRPSTWAHVESAVVDISKKIRDLVAEAIFDLDNRAVGQRSRARILLEALEAVCTRHTNISPASLAEGQAKSGSRPEISLYDSLIRRSPSDESMFILDALERVSPDVLSGMGGHMESVGSILQRAYPPRGYWERFRELCSRAGLTHSRHF